MIAILITAPGERYRLAHLQSFVALDRTRCGQLVTGDWQGLPVEITTPMCRVCESVRPQPPRREPVAAPSALVGSSDYPTTQPSTPTPYVPAETLARAAERTPRGSHHSAIWRILAALTNPKG